MAQNDKILLGKVALVTGASSGIGSKTAILFSKLGAQVALTGRNVEKLEEIAKCCPQHSEIVIIPADLTKGHKN